ncbi:MAG: hypothetical protein D6692_02890 [Planctomycetota bacterium]|nr:MAG: hypothetical protein D6692_02890 [Planctomycetota bacterium]
MEQKDSSNPARVSVSTDAVEIARRLTGDLLCIGCGYNLRGLSIRDPCPECGLPVRATILGVIDPRAHELEPLTRPLVSAVGLGLWAGGAWVAVMSVVLMRAAEVAREVLGSSFWPTWASMLGLTGVVLSGLGATTLIRPHRGATRGAALLSAVGVAAYVPLAFLYHAIYAKFDSASPSPFLNPGTNEFSRAAFRLGMLACVGVAILCLRPSARMLSARSVIVRTGRADRQSMLALLASFAVAGVGDVLHVISASASGGVSDLLATIAMVFVAVGSVLVVVGVTNIGVDVWRLWPVIVRPGVGLVDVLEANEDRDRRIGSG